MAFGGSWAPFGRGLGLSGASLGRFWGLLAGFLNLQNLAFVKHWPKMDSKRPLVSNLNGFGKGSGRIWEGLGGILANFWMDFGPILLISPDALRYSLVHHLGLKFAPIRCRVGSKLDNKSTNKSIQKYGQI